MSLIGKHIDRITTLALAEPLKAAGFTRSGRTFRRHEPDGSIAVIQVQASQFNHGDAGRFTINLGIYLPPTDLLIGMEVQETPQEYHCHLRERIGCVMPEKQDFWWEVDEHSDDAAVAAELREAVLVHGLAWLAGQDARKRAYLEDDT